MKLITQARSIIVERNIVDLEFLISRWSTDIHMFVACWSKLNLPLEDVALLYSVWRGPCHRDDSDLKTPKESRVSKKVLLDLQVFDQQTYLSWVNFFY